MPEYSSLRADKADDEVLGPTLKAIILDQFARSLFGPQGDFYLGKDLGGYTGEVEECTLAEVINANSGANLQPTAFYA